jgi:hypothetical protein
MFGSAYGSKESDGMTDVSIHCRIAYCILSRAKRAYYFAGARKRARNMYVALFGFSSFGCYVVVI